MSGGHTHLPLITSVFMRCITTAAFIWIQMWRYEKVLTGCFHRIIAPLVLQKGFEKEYRVKMTDRDKKTVIHGGTLYPYDYFSPKNVYSGKICRSDNSYCIHHFSQSWLTESRKVRISRRIHLCVIRLAGRKNHNRLLYLLRRISGRRI